MTTATSPSPMNPWNVTHLVIIMFENQRYDEIVKDSRWQQVIQNGLSISNMYALTHPSQPNYIAQLGGSIFYTHEFGDVPAYGIYGDSNVDIDASTVIDLMEQYDSTVTWKMYAENYTSLANGRCNPASSISIDNYAIYYRKHVPHLSFSTITKNQSRCQNIVNSGQLDVDIEKQQVPNFVYYTPNIMNDGHDVVSGSGMTAIEYSGQYMNAWLSNYWKRLPENTLIMVTFDEDDRSGDNQIVNVLVGPHILPNTTYTSDSSTHFNQYSVTKLIEDLFANSTRLQRNDSNSNVTSLSIVLKQSTQQSRQETMALSSSIPYVAYPYLSVSHETPSSSSMDNTVTLIIGAVIGTVIGFILLCAMLITYRRYRSKHQHPRESIETQSLNDARFTVSDEVDSI
jgi:hypothetical protein